MAKRYPPIMLATWSFGASALESAWPTLLAPDGGALDAVEAAGRYAESDLSNHTVGIGGLPDRDGNVSLDAAIMLSPSHRGGVCAVRTVDHPITLARRVAERSPHTLIAGDGADALAAEEGFAAANLLTPAAKDCWERWKAQRTTPAGGAGLPVPNFEEHPVSNPEGRNLFHDTIGVLALDSRGTLAAGCTTSGLPWKLPGRVGDSPIVGHGLYVDPGVGGCVCTGHGELVSSVCGAFLAVELLRNGSSPQAAASGVLDRIISAFTLTDRDQVGILVMDRQGNYSGASLRAGFAFALRTESDRRMITPSFALT